MTTFVVSNSPKITNTEPFLFDVQRWISNEEAHLIWLSDRKQTDKSPWCLRFIGYTDARWKLGCGEWLTTST